MSERAADFLDSWLQDNIAERRIGARMTPAGLVRRCISAARKAGLTKEELAAVVGDLQQAINDELAIKNRRTPR